MRTSALCRFRQNMQHSCKALRTSTNKLILGKATFEVLTVLLERKPSSNMEEEDARANKKERQAEKQNAVESVRGMYICLPVR